jgi:hypothetical protein
MACYGVNFTFYELFIYYDISCLNNVFSKNMLKIGTLTYILNLFFLFIFPIVSSSPYLNFACRKMYRRNNAYESLLYSVYWISCCLHADQILPNLPAPHKILSSSWTKELFVYLTLAHFNYFLHSLRHLWPFRLALVTNQPCKEHRVLFSER